MEREYADDCIHLHACRRLTAAARKAGIRLKRNCTKENCNAYVCGGTRAYITAERAAELARCGYEEMRGYDPYDVYTERDFSECTLSELIEIEKEG